MSKKENDTNKLPTKVFSQRESLITELLEVKHFKILKHLFITLLFGYIARDIVRALSSAKDVNFGFTTIRIGFKNFHYALACWIVLFGISLLVYVLFRCWALWRTELYPKSMFTKVWDTIFLFLIALYYVVCLFIFPLLWMKSLHLGLASFLALLSENARLLMKSHAFIRTNAPDVITYKPHSENPLDLPTLSNYVYFSFAPTLVYRKEYPRTENVVIKKALLDFLEVFCIIWLESYIVESFLLKPFSHVGKLKIDWIDIAVTVTENSIAGGLLMLANFYQVLHAWCNAFANLLRFADRRFYEDWWTSTNYSAYFRHWNIVVHDWLYEYVYRDFYHYLIPNNKTAAKYMVFLISALMHEQIIGFSTGYFLPVVFVQFFGLGTHFTFIQTKHPMCNVFLLYSLALGNSINLSMHAIEYYARVNCPYPDRENSSKLLPRLITLDCV
ncbi:hypothetical protein AMK59_2135 [Oryctes borbonicus]|uniref:O-acyltransferase n=1 Tax=Oryctes borbonicus TaxID=1629725 RepID=A0A0T6BCL9_9SCAR|nr:hypothetical protein AMK59_2135 [Oryctes borbonicus]